MVEDKNLTCIAAFWWHDGKLNDRHSSSPKAEAYPIKKKTRLTTGTVVNKTSHLSGGFDEHLY